MIDNLSIHELEMLFWQKVTERAVKQAQVYPLPYNPDEPFPDLDEPDDDGDKSKQAEETEE